jgi:hypothetical protein
MVRTTAYSGNGARYDQFQESGEFGFGAKNYVGNYGFGCPMLPHVAHSCISKLDRHRFL